MPTPLKPQLFGGWLHPLLLAISAKRLTAEWSVEQFPRWYFFLQRRSPALCWKTVRKILGSVASEARARKFLSEFGPKGIEEDYQACRCFFFFHFSRGESSEGASPTLVGWKFCLLWSSVISSASPKEPWPWLGSSVVSAVLHGQRCGYQEVHESPLRMQRIKWLDRNRVIFWTWKAHTVLAAQWQAGGLTTGNEGSLARRVWSLEAIHSAL